MSHIEADIYQISDLFTVKSGDYHSTEALDEGEVPLISCGDIGNGLVGFYDISDEYVYSHALTVAYNGSWPLTAKFHPYKFATKDDVAVLIPKQNFDDNVLLYVAAQLNRQTWRYSYGRKCFREKLMRFKVLMPKNRSYLDELPFNDWRLLLPSGQPISEDRHFGDLRWQAFSVGEIFEYDRGDFHSIADLDPGDVMTISRVTTDNGVFGYFTRPAGAKVYPKGCITVSTVGGDAFVQLDDFMATDNVIVCRPKLHLGPEGLFFLAMMLNRQKWRYSYGRQCYLQKFSRIQILLPVTIEGNIDVDTISRIARSVGYWSRIEKELATGSEAECCSSR